MNKLKKSIYLSLAAFVAIFSLSFSLIPASATYAKKAETICDKSDVPDEVKAANGCDVSAKKKSKELSEVVTRIVNGVIAALGAVAVIFIVVGGVNYMTSQGDPGKVKKAKDTILYAGIGLVICALAFVIVNFVIKNVLK